MKINNAQINATKLSESINKCNNVHEFITCLEQEYVPNKFLYCLGQFCDNNVPSLVKALTAIGEILATDDTKEIVVISMVTQSPLLKHMILGLIKAELGEGSYCFLENKTESNHAKLSSDLFKEIVDPDVSLVTTDKRYAPIRSNSKYSNGTKINCKILIFTGQPLAVSCNLDDLHLPSLSILECCFAKKDIASLSISDIDGIITEERESSVMLSHLMWEMFKEEPFNSKSKKGVA